MTRSLPVFDDLLVSDALPALVIGDDAIEGGNAAAHALFGTSADLLCSMPLASFLPAVQPDGGESLRAWRERVDAARGGLTQWFLWQFVRSDGGLIDALVHLEVEPEKDRHAGRAFRAPVRARLRDLTQFRGIEWSRMQQALAGTAAIVFAKDAEGHYLFANRQFAEITGRTLDEILGRRDIEVLPPDMAEECGRHDSQVLAERRPLDFEEHGYLAGEPRTYLALKFPLLRADGGAYGVWGIATDITARKRTEEALHHAALAVSQADGEGLVQALTRYLATILVVDIALIGVIEGEGDRRVVRTIGGFGDGEFRENFSYPLNATPCQTVLEGFRCYRSGVREAFPDSRALGMQDIEGYAGYPLRGSDGQLLGVIAALSRMPMEDEALIESVLKIFAGRAAGEIERRRAEDALRTSEASYRAIFDASEDAILIHDWDTGAIVDVNPKACRAYGFTATEMLGMVPAQLSSGEPPYTEETTLILTARAKAGIPTTVEWHRRNKDGSLHWDEVHIKPAEIAGKRRVIAFTREITARKLAEHALRESEEQYRAIFNASVDGMVLFNSAGQVVDVNEAFAQMHGFGIDELIGGDCERFVPEDRRDDCKRMVRAALEGRSMHGESVACRYGGSTFDVEAHVVPMQYRNEPHVLAIVRDLTERKREEARREQLEAQLRQAQKMEAIGHLTGGIAHDFNNLLASIMGYVVLAVERQATLGDARLGRYLEQAQMSCERARDLIRQMLTFSRGRRGEPRPLALGAAVRDATTLLRASFPSTVEIRADLDAELPAVLIDPVQLEQVLLNLCINARDAMHASGAVRVATGWRRGYRGVCTSCRQSLEGDFVELAVADTGPGIPASVLDRIFEPFFSTKEVGKGSGMGLATVHGIVHDHRGHVVVESTDGAGATFRVLLPPLDPAIEGSRIGARAPAAAPSAHEPLRGSVLLVDDEAAVLGFMRELLENWGLEVIAIGDPLEARRRVANGEIGFDLVLADQTMPHLTGTELARAIATLRPKVPILLYTGYRDGAPQAELSAGRIRAVLDKPVDPAALHEQLKRHLARSDEPSRRL